MDYSVKQWGYFKLEDNQKDVENIISLPLTVKNNYLTWVNKHGTLIYTNMFYTVAPDKTNFRFYTNTVGGENLIPYKCIYADENKVVIAPLKFVLDKNNELVENGVDETKKMEFLR